MANIYNKRYTVQVGDTLQRLAQRFLGSPARYMELLNYNRGRIGMNNEIFPGMILLIPLDITLEPDSPKVVIPAGAHPKSAFIEIEGKPYINWRTVKIKRSMKTISDSFEFSASFDPSSRGALIRPFSYQECRVNIGEDVVLTGTIEKIVSEMSNTGRKLTIVGRSKAGLLNEVCITEEPFEFKDNTYIQIVEALVNKYGINVTADDSITDGGGEMSTVSATFGQTVKSFLNSLSISKGYLLTSRPNGSLKIIRASSGSPVDALTEGESRIISASCVFDGTKRFSPLSVQYQTPFGGGIEDGEEIDTVLDDIGVKRPLGIVPDTSKAEDDPTTIAQWERGKREAASMPVVITLDTWYDRNDKLWVENSIVSVEIPSCYVYNKTEMLIESVMYTLDPDNGTRCQLTLVLPSAYTITEKPSTPWDIAELMESRYGRNLLE